MLHKAKLTRSRQRAVFVVNIQRNIIKKQINRTSTSRIRTIHACCILHASVNQVTDVLLTLWFDRAKKVKTEKTS